MNLFESLVLGIIQGLTEFLPVSSSGHLELGKYLFGINPETNFYFTVAVHGATVLSTLVVFWKDIMDLLRGFVKIKLNEETIYILKIIVSMIPVAFIGVFMKDYFESFFAGNMIALGLQFIFTAAILLIPGFIKVKEKPISWIDAFIIGVAQAVAVLPAISRSGATIATGLMLGNRKEEIAKFSFLMVLVPVIGANMVELHTQNIAVEKTSWVIILSGFFAAFISGYFACRWMVNLVKKGKLIWFALYCLLIGQISILLGYNVI
jgi:undecaprenyl-diphosphatase